MAQNKDYSVEIIRYSIPKDKSKDFERDYNEASKYLEDSPYCLEYRMLHGDDETTNYILIIHWSSKEDHLNKFRQSPQFSSFFNLVRPYYNNIEEMKHYNETSMSWERTPEN